MGALFSWLFPGDKRAPIKNPLQRITNMFVNNYRGILGVLVPIVFLTWRVEKGKSVLEFMWMSLFWIYLLQPISIPAASMIPVFLLPMTGLLDSVSVCKCYLNEGIFVFILSSMVMLLLNNSGADRRIALSIMCSGSSQGFCEKSLLRRCSFAAFLLSMLSNRLIVTTIITQYVTPIFLSVGKSDSAFNKVRFIMNNAIQTSSAIGSTAIMHSAYCTHAFRTIWTQSCLGAPNEQYPEIFNYLQYSFFAVPVAIIMYIVNLIYHTVLLSITTDKPLSAASIADVRSQLLKYKSSIPHKITSHEYLTMFCLLLLLILLCASDNKLIRGWTTYNSVYGKPVIKDCTILAIFVIFLHALPRTLNFLKFITKRKKSQLTLKPESSILFWRFVNSNVNYAYFMVLGAGVTLDAATKSTELYKDITAYAGAPITNLDWHIGLLLVCLVSSAMANAMSGVPVVVVVLPFIINMAREGVNVPWIGNLYIAAVGVGIATSLGFMWPFLYTPAHICHYVGKVPMAKMAKYSLLSVILCCLVLWVSLIVWAPVIWDPSGAGIVCAPAASIGSVETTTAAAEGGGGGGGEEGL